ncbi:hypothetical protein [Planococcus salinarum]|uniref:hypothetical protein n=1 Tax=Planococcus salinarum TaxID=622695 RepID=UPI000E3DF84E|nr:hypothetical protein [Planococcus salinarum]TAA72280.1 hypothetical protein D2909_06830 [Planococcus salinarum]
MEPRRSRKEFRKTKHLKETGLSYGVAHMTAKPLDREGSKFLEFLMHVFLFILGGIILCGMLIALLTLS